MTDSNNSTDLGGAADAELLKLGVYGASDLATLVTSETQYLVEGLLPSGSIILLVGDSGLGKTPLAITLGLSVASGKPFLDRSVTSGRVLYCDSETPIASFLGMMKTISADLGLTSEPDAIKLWSPSLTPKVSAELGEEIALRVALWKPSLVIVDPLRTFWPRAEEKTSDAIAMVERMRALSKQYGCSWLVNHHRRKVSQYGVVSLEDEPYNWLQESAGSFALVNNSDVRLGIEPPRGSKGNVELVIAGFARNTGQLPTI